jgi:hypothetical protein
VTKANQITYPSFDDGPMARNVNLLAFVMALALRRKFTELL